MATVALAAVVLTGCKSVPRTLSLDDVHSLFSKDCSCSIIYAGECKGEEHAIYRIASLTKLFLEELALTLHSKRIVNLDSPIELEELHEDYRDLTFRELLENKSALPREFLDKTSLCDFCMAVKRAWTGEDLYQDFGSMDAFFACLNDEKWRKGVRERDSQTIIYSNVGYALLALAIERKTGKGIEELLREHIIAPLSLDDTAYELTSEQKKRFVPSVAGDLPWGRQRGEAVKELELGEALQTMGCLKSSVRDVEKLLDEYYWGLLETHRTSLLQRRRLDCGIVVWYRFGMIYGGSSFVCLDPLTKRKFIMLRNATFWPDEDIFDTINALWLQP